MAIYLFFIMIDFSSLLSFDSEKIRDKRLLHFVISIFFEFMKNENK